MNYTWAGKISEIRKDFIAKFSDHKAGLTKKITHIVQAEQARTQGIIGICPKAVLKIKSGVRSWLSLSKARFGSVDLAMPPRVGDLVAWHATSGGAEADAVFGVWVHCRTASARQQV